LTGHYTNPLQWWIGLVAVNSIGSQSEHEVPIDWGLHSN